MNGIWFLYSDESSEVSVITLSRKLTLFTQHKGVFDRTLKANKARNHLVLNEKKRFIRIIEVKEDGSKGEEMRVEPDLEEGMKIDDHGVVEPGKVIISSIFRNDVLRLSLIEYNLELGHWDTVSQEEIENKWVRGKWSCILQVCPRFEKILLYFRLRDHNLRTSVFAHVYSIGTTNNLQFLRRIRLDFELVSFASLGYKGRYLVFCGIEHYGVFHAFFFNEENSDLQEIFELRKEIGVEYVGRMIQIQGGFNGVDCKGNNVRIDFEYPRES